MNNSPILNDYVFKQVFGQHDNDPILISFLNAMLDGDVHVKTAKILNSEMPRAWEFGRSILLDVQVQIDDGTYIDVEVHTCFDNLFSETDEGSVADQNGYKTDLVDRMVVYGANMITRYSEKATKYSSDKCIAIWILNCNIPDFKLHERSECYCSECNSGNKFGNDPIVGALVTRC